MTEILQCGAQFHLRNDRISYSLYLLEGGIPMHLYFGRRVERLSPVPFLRRAGLATDGSFSMQECSLDHVPQEYPQYGLGEMREGALTVRLADGTATSDLRFVSAGVTDGKCALRGLPATFGTDCKTLTITLRDSLTGLEALLRYTVFDDCDVIARSAELRNTSSQTITLERAYSLCLDLPTMDWELITLSGAWARERELIRRPLCLGETSVSSLRGCSSLQTSPFMALVRRETTERQGEAIGMALVYSGSFYAGVTCDHNRTVRAMMGINDRGFGWQLEKGESFQTPEALLVYSQEGLGGMSAQFHRICAQHLTRGRYRDADRPILLNNWEATYFGFDEEKLCAIAATAADVGVELFVLDDGWFGHRDDDRSSLGDWTPDPRKLPLGLGHLADRIHGMGLKFGLWFEPEMVSPDSELYRAHPDWCIHVEGRERIEGRHQLVLDLSRADVQEYVYHAVADILSAYGVDYVKWDMNRNMTNIGSALLPPDKQREVPHRYMLGLYSVLERLVQDFPHVLFESCSSGGGRFDLGMLYYMPQTWCSDDTDAVARCRIQYSTSMVFPPFAMGSHVSAVPNHQTGRVTPLSTRGHVAMSGCFGYELDLNRLTREELEEVRAQIARVKRLRHTLLYGSFHRLLSPYESIPGAPYAHDTAWITVSADRREAVFMYMRPQSMANELPPIVRFAGLDRDMVYDVEETGESYTGAELLESGLCFPLPGGDAASVSYTLRARP